MRSYAGCSDWSDRTCVHTTYLGSLLGAVELTDLCTFACKVGCFDAQIRGVVLYK